MYTVAEMQELAGVDTLDNRRQIHLAGLMYRMSAQVQYQDNRQLLTIGNMTKFCWEFQM